MKNLYALMIVSSIALGSAQAAIDFIWYADNKQASGNFNGCFNDGSHWFQGTVQSGATGVEPYGATNAAVFQWGTDWTVTFPTDVDVYTNYAKFNLKVEPGAKRTFDGTGSTYAHPYNEVGDYPYDSQLAIYWRASTSDGVSNKDVVRTLNNQGKIGGVVGYQNNPSFEFTDFKFYAESPTGTKDMKIVFEKGTYNFLNPCGVNWDKNSQFPCVYFFGGQATAFYQDKNEVVFEKDATLKANTLGIQGSNAPTNIFQFKGGEHLIATVDMASRFNGWTINENRSVIDFRVDDGARVKVTNVIGMSTVNAATNRVMRVIVTDDSQLEVSSISASRGHGEIRADGGRIVLGKAGLYDSIVTRTEAAYPASFDLVAENGGELVMDHGGTKGLEFGSKLAVASFDYNLVVDNALLTLKPSSKINVHGVYVNVRNGGVVDNAGVFAIRGSSDVGAIPTIMTIDGTVVTNRSNATMNIGQGAAGANLILTNGATLVYRSGGSTTVTRGEVTLYPGTTIDNDGKFTFNGVAGETHTMIIDGATMTNGTSGNFVLSNAGATHLVLTNNSYLVLGGSSGMTAGGDTANAYSAGAEDKTCVIDMYDGKIVQADGKDGLNIRLGLQAGSKGTFNLHDGEIRLFKSGTSANGVFCGYYGTGEMNIYGGVLDCFRPRVAYSSSAAYDYSNGEESVFRVYGGEVISRSQGNGAMVGFAVGGDGYGQGSTVRKARLVLNGGIVTSYTIYGGGSAQHNGGTGWVAFEADGGTIRPLSAASPCMLFHFDEAKLGPKGLTVDARGFNGNTLAQHVWSNKDGENGMLRFVGAGYTTVTGNVEQVSYIVADGGTVRLQMLDGNALDTLVITNGGTVCINANQMLSIKDFRDDGTGYINILNGCAANTSYKPFVFVGEPSAEAMNALMSMVEQGRIIGLGQGLAANMQFADEGGGSFSATMTVRAADDLIIPLEAGAVSNATANITCSGYDTIVADVGEGAALTLSGVYKYGPFKLIGGGKASFDSLADHLYDTFIAKYGVLEVTGPGAQTWDGQLTLNQNSTNDIFVVKNDVDLTMPCLTGSGGNGELVKRGAGTLTLTVGAGETKTLAGGSGKGHVSTSYGIWGTSATDVNQLAYDAGSGMVTNSGVPAFVVAEGEMRIEGKGNNAKVNVGGICDIGIASATGTVQPGLVLDNVWLNQTRSPENWSFLAHGINCNEGGVSRSDDFAVSPYLILTNNAIFRCAQFEIGRMCGGNVAPRLVVDGSTFFPYYWFSPNQSSYESVKPELIFRNGARLFTRYLLLYRDVDIYFDNTVVAYPGTDVNGPLGTIKIYPISSMTLTTATYIFRNGSKLYCHEIDPVNLNAQKFGPVTLSFDDSTWIPSTNEVADYTFEWAKPEQVLIAVTNVGLRLPVPAAATWTMNQPVKGTGGVVMDGEGVLKFGPGAIAYTGVTRLDSGTVDLSSAGDVAALTISGSGTLKDASIGALTLQTFMEDGVPVSVPTLDGVTARRRVIDFQNQLSEAEVKALSNVVIGHYEGTAPGNAKWRIAGTPLTNARGHVSCANGDIVLQSVSAGPGSVFTFR